MPVVGLNLDNWAPSRLTNSVWIVFTAILVLVVGLRNEVGGDWGPYQSFVDRAAGMPLTEALRYQEDGFAFLNWLGANGFGGIYFVNLSCAILAIIPLVLFCRSRPSPWIALVVAVPYLIIVVCMGYTRHSVAIGMTLLAIMCLESRRFFLALAWITLASLFHRTAIVLAPLVVVCMWFAQQRKPATILMAIAYVIALSWFTFGQVLWAKLNSYVALPISSIMTELDLAPSEAASSTSNQGPVHSGGALIRIGLGCVAGAAYLFFGRRSELGTGRAAIWTSVAVANFLLLPTALIFSTLADRIALYLIALQMHTAPLLDSILAGRQRLLFRFAMIMAYLTLLFGWLYFSDYSQHWLPYGNLLL